MANATEQTETPGPQPETAKRFFERAAEVAVTNNYDYAIELYRDGIKWDPDALEAGHRPLYEVALKRKAAGGKPAGMRDQAAARKSGTPAEKVSWAAYLLAKEPDNPKLMELLLSAALKANAPHTARWIAVHLTQANRDGGRPSLDRYMLVIDSLEKIEDFDNAVATCQLACRLKPNDLGLTTRLKNLSAMQTLRRGNYETAENFKGSLNNANKQLEQQQDQNLVSQDNILDRQIATARRELAANPHVAGKIYLLCDLLCKRGRQVEEDEALATLDRYYDQTRSYRFHERAGDIRMRQFQRKALAAVAALKADPNNMDLRRAAQLMVRDARNFAETEYAERVANYPTDLTLKFELGRRLFENGKFDQAIPILQQAESDAKNRLRALSLLGQAFFNLGFFSEAVSTYRRAIEAIELAGTDTAKDLHYNLGLALEQMGRPAEADAAYSQVVQWDFNFRDTRSRIQKLRLRQSGETPGGPAQK